MTVCNNDKIMQIHESPKRAKECSGHEAKMPSLHPQNLKQHNINNKSTLNILNTP